MPTNTKGACLDLKVKAKSQGFSEVKVTYQYMDVKLEATVTIAAYLPLKVSFFSIFRN